MKEQEENKKAVQKHSARVRACILRFILMTFLSKR